MDFRFLFALAFTFTLLGCDNEKIGPVISQVTSKDFDEESEISAQLANGFELNLWAPGPLLKNAVALSFANDGTAYLTETARRKSSDIDIRQHREWMVEDLSLQNLEDTKAFHKNKLSADLSSQNTWQQDFNKDGIHDFRDLAVQSERVVRVWDSDNDGRADFSQVFADRFNSVITGIAAGVLHHDDNVFLTVAPDLWRLEDIDADGISDVRTSLVNGFAIHVGYAGHDMSGLTIGPDGKVYWSIGDIGVNVTSPEGKNWNYPNQGAIMRCNPDGTEFEVFAHGLRNTQEFAFDNYGNLLSLDNDSDYPGEHERYVHILEGSDSGWRIHWQYGKYNLPNENYRVWQSEKLHIPHFPGQAAYITPTIAKAYDGPCGFAFNPGTALSEEYKDHFFASYFKATSARSKVQAFKIKPKGASFDIVGIKDIVGGIVPTGIDFAPDGALYINDWKDSYDLKPAGRIWKLDVHDQDRNPLRGETQILLKAGMKNKSTNELNEFLAHPDQRVRLEAQFQLVKNDDFESLLKAAKENKNLFARLHAIWGIGQLAREENSIVHNLLPLLNDKESHVRAQIAKLLGEAKYHHALDPLMESLQDDDDFVKYYSAEALGKLKSAEAFDPLVALLEKIEESDPHLRHGVLYALSNLNTESSLAKLSTHSSKFVRVGAVVALRMMKSPSVVNFLGDDNSMVLVETARAIHDDNSIEEALPTLAKSLGTSKCNDEAFVRRAINANLRLGDAQSALRLAKFAVNPLASNEMRLDALWALGYWAEPPKLDRVEGKYRELDGHQLADAHVALDKIFARLLHHDSFNSASIITAAGRLKYNKAETELLGIFKKGTRDVSVLRAALETLRQLKSKDLVSCVDQALTDGNVSLRLDAQKLIDELQISENRRFLLINKILKTNPIPEKQAAFVSLSKLTSLESEQALEVWFDRLAAGDIDPALQLDVLMAIENCSFDNLKNRKIDYENSLGEDDLHVQFSSSLFGGNIEDGKNIFRRNESAQCLRCHIVGGMGGEVGPDLSKIANRLSREELLQSLVEPNSKIAPGYGTVILELTNDQKMSGIIQKETDEILSIKIGNEKPQTIAKESIRKRETLPSGMPSVASILDKAQVRDLMAYLVTLN